MSARLPESRERKSPDVAADVGPEERRRVSAPVMRMPDSHLRGCIESCSDTSAHPPAPFDVET